MQELQCNLMCNFLRWNSLGTYVLCTIVHLCRCTCTFSLHLVKLCLLGLLNWKCAQTCNNVCQYFLFGKYDKSAKMYIQKKPNVNFYKNISIFSLRRNLISCSEICLILLKTNSLVTHHETKNCFRSRKAEILPK